jgi:hypothetical protein
MYKFVQPPTELLTVTSKPQYGGPVSEDVRLACEAFLGPVRCCVGDHFLRYGVLTEIYVLETSGANRTAILGAWTRFAKKCKHHARTRSNPNELS